MHQIVVFCLVNALLIGQAYSACQKSSLLNAKDSIGRLWAVGSLGIMRTCNALFSIGPAVGGSCIAGYNCFAVNGGDYCFTRSPTCPPSSTAVNTAVIGPAIGGVCALGTCYLVNGSENCYACVDNTASCANWKNNGFCSSSSMYGDDAKRSYCPKTCGYCK